MVAYSGSHDGYVMNNGNNIGTLPQFFFGVLEVHYVGIQCLQIS